jgi:hypothetical protein
MIWSVERRLEAVLLMVAISLPTFRLFRSDIFVLPFRFAFMAVSSTDLLWLSGGLWRNMAANSGRHGTRPG